MEACKKTLRRTGPGRPGHPGWNPWALVEPERPSCSLGGRSGACEALVQPGGRRGAWELVVEPARPVVERPSCSLGARRAAWAPVVEPARPVVKPGILPYNLGASRTASPHLSPLYYGPINRLIFTDFYRFLPIFTDFSDFLPSSCLLSFQVYYSLGSLPRGLLGSMSSP